MGEHDQADVDVQVRSWLSAWGVEVAARDFDAAERRMAADVVGFGTLATVARGLDALRSDQWEHVWPAIDGFGFDAEGADVWVSPDGRQAVIGTAWHSIGRNEFGDTFPRGGRATVVLTRDGPDSMWLGRHTHFSLQPVDPATFTGAQ